MPCGSKFACTFAALTVLMHPGAVNIVLFGAQVFPLLLLMYEMLPAR